MFTVNLAGGPVYKYEDEAWRTADGTVVKNPKYVQRLDYYQNQNITDPSAQDKIDAQKDAEIRARIAARAQTYAPVDVSQPVLQPIKIGKEIIKPDDPRYARIAASIKP